MCQQFYNREKELDFLEQQYLEKGSNFIVIYGRRRVGKTELLKQFIKNKNSIYYLLDEQKDEINISGLQNKFSQYFENELLSKVKLDNWYELFNEFVNLKKKEKIILVLDEFPYLIKNNKAIPSIFQKIWDEILKDKNIMLIICGSSVSIMENDVLSYKSPLYGRRTGQWKVNPFNFKESRFFLKSKNFEENIYAYAIFDGIPLYLKKYNPKLNIYKNIIEKISSKGQLLYEEAEFLLKQEFREPGNYFLILKAISYGKTKFSDIINFTNLDKTVCSKYLDNLITIKAVKKSFPVTLDKEKSRITKYYISDNYLKFWFSMIYPNRHLIEEDKFNFNIIKEQFNFHTSYVFENICMEFMKSKFEFNKIGRWWHKDKEIDIILLKENNIIFAECKWQNNVDAEKLFIQLKEKSKFVDWKKDVRKEKYILFAKSFKKKLNNCYDLKDIDKVLK
ncbi:MAG: ATP-binding protein [Candidatus Woesearchaeota archaeon]